MAARYVESRANAYLVEQLEAQTDLARFARSSRTTSTVPAT